MAINFYLTESTLGKLRDIINGDRTDLITFDHVEFLDLSGNVVATLPVESVGSDAVDATVYRFSCQDKSDAEYACYSVKVYDTEGDVAAASYMGMAMGGGTSEPIFTKSQHAEMMAGFEIHFASATQLDCIYMGNPTFRLDSASEALEGVVELATEAEAKAGTDTKRAITPKTLDATIKAHGDVVHRSGAETIAGNKTFTGSFVISKDSPFILVSQNDVVKGTKPPTSQYMGLAFVDSEGQGTVNRLGLVETKYMADGGICLSLSAYKPENGSTASAGIEIIYPITGSPYINVPAPANGDSSNKIATTAWVKAVADKLLSLAGGTMTGGIKHQVDSPVIKNINSAKQTIIAGGTTQEDGGTLFLFGKDNNDSPGIFVLRANNGTLVSSLFGYADGKLQWGGKNIVRSVNGTAADAAGNVVIKLDFLPLTGGAMKATKAITRDVNDSYISIHGGTGNNNDGAQIDLCGANHETMPSAFQIHARNASVDKILRGLVDGTLTWDSKTVLTNSTSMPTNSSGVVINGGKDYQSGAYFRLYGKDDDTYPGWFMLGASDGSKTSTLRGLPDGTLTWDGSEALLPAGAVFAYAANKSIAGCLICNGAAVSRTTYARLFNAIGTTYGAGDGSTTFNLPNLTDRFIQGSGTGGTVKAAGLPNITGTLKNMSSADDSLTPSASGAFSATQTGRGYENVRGGWTINFDASGSNSIYGKSTTVQPPALTMRFFIKY